MTSNPDNRRVWDFPEMNNMSLRTSRYSLAPEQADPAPEQVYIVAPISYSPPVYTTLTPVEAVVSPLIVAPPPPSQIPASQPVPPSTSAGTNAATESKKRGRPPGSKNKPKN